LQKAGGTFTLTADVDFGATYGLKSVYYKSRNTPSTAGIVRLGNNESVGWRNAANSANLELKANASNLLEYNGSLIGILAAALTPSRALVSDGSGNVSVSSVTSTQLAYLASATGTTGTTSTNLVFSTSPTFITPTLGAASATSINKVAITAPATGSTLTIADGKTVTLSKPMTVTSADDTSTLTLAAGAQTVGGSGAADITTNSGTQNLLNKTVVSSTSATTGALNIPTGTVAQRPTAATGMIRHNSDTGEFEGYSNAAWQSIGGGVNERAIKNYYKAYAQSTIASGTLSTVASTGNITVSGSGLSVTSAFYADVTSGASALTQDTSSAIRGTNSYLSALSSANTNGSVYFQFPAFVLDPVDLGKPVSVSFDLTSSIADGDYDVCMVRYTVSSTTGTYAEVIPIAGNASSSSVTPSAKLPTGTTSFQGFFIAGSTSTDVYALRIRRLVGSATIKLDSLYVGPQSVVQGAAVTDWVACTVTGSWVSNTTYTAKYRQDGDMADFDVMVATSGAPTSAALNINLPTGMVIDTNKLAAGTATQATTLGYVATYDNAGAYSLGCVGYNSTTSVALITINAAGTYVSTASNITQIAPFTFGAGDYVYARFKCPIVGWSSNVTMANRAVERYFYTSESFDAAGSTTVEGTDGQATTNLTAARTKTLTIPNLQPTDRVALEFRYENSSAWFDASQLAPLLLDGAGTGISGCYVSTATSTTVAVTFTSKKWSAFDGAPTTDWGTNLRWRVRVTSGGASVGYPISPANLVKSIARYTTNAGQTLTSGAAAAVIDFEDKTFDTKSEVTTGASWKFTAKEGGYYRIKSQIMLNSTAGWAAGEFLDMYIRKNGTNYTNNTKYFDAAVTGYAICSIDDVVQLKAGEYMDITAQQNNGANISLYSGASLQSYITIEQVG